MKRLFIILAIIVLTSRYANAGSLRSRVRREANVTSEENEDKTKSVVTNVVDLMMHVPIVNQPLSNLVNRAISMARTIDKQTAGLFSSVMNACWSCLENNQELNDCWEQDISPAVCQSVSPMIKLSIQDPMLEPMLELGIHTMMRSILKIC